MYRGAVKVMGSKSLDMNKRRAQMTHEGERAWEFLLAGESAEAVASYTRVVEWARELGDLRAEAVYATNLGAAYFGLNDREAARKHIEHAAELAGRNNFTEIEGHAYFLLAEDDRDHLHSDHAIHNFLRALECAFACHDDVTCEMCFGNLGRLYLERGWAEQGADCLRQAVETRSDSEFRGVWLGTLGMAMAELAQYDAAIGYYREACAIAVANEDKHTEATCRGSEGNALFELGDYEGAIKCYEQALALSRNNGEQGRVATWLGNIGNTWLRRNDVGKALNYCEQAVEAAKAVGDKHAESAHLDSLGDCYVAQGELSIAQDKYQEAIDLSKQIYDRLGERISLSNLGRVYERNGQLQPAFDLFVKAIDLFDEQRSMIKADDLKTSFANRGQDLYRDMIKVCLAMGKRVEALEFVGRSKSRALLDLLSNSPIDISELSSSEDESLRRLMLRESELRQQIAQLERLFWQGPPTAETGHRGGGAPVYEDTHQLYTEWRETVNQLRRRHPNYASLVAANTLNFDEIRSLWRTTNGANDPVVGADTAILEFYWTDLFVMAASVWTGADQPHTHTIFDDKERAALEMDLQSFLEMSATEGWEVPLSLCKRLYKLLLEPVMRVLPPTIYRLVIVPHGILHHLPFAALHDGTGFVCEKYAISYVPTTSLIPVLAGGDAKQKRDVQGYLISAISDYSATRQNGVVFSSRLRSAAGLEDLSYTMEEAQTIYKLGAERSAETRLLTNEEVKQSLPELFSKYPVVHFAGHAVFNPDEPLASGLVLADGSILTAAAILQGNALRTNCGKLLVLSACQTGVNTVTAGGEILGLARALMYAGMPNLVLSLWEVADRSTAVLMQDFHKELIEMSSGDKSKDGMRISDALRTAQAKAATSGQPLHAWAPFIHLGID